MISSMHIPDITEARAFQCWIATGTASREQEQGLFVFFSTAPAAMSLSISEHASLNKVPDSINSEEVLLLFSETAKHFLVTPRQEQV
jgi:hypothetical protein